MPYVFEDELQPAQGSRYVFEDEQEPSGAGLTDHMIAGGKELLAAEGTNEALKRADEINQPGLEHSPWGGSGGQLFARPEIERRLKAKTETGRADLASDLQSLLDKNRSLSDEAARVNYSGSTQKFLSNPDPEASQWDDFMEDPLTIIAEIGSRSSANMIPSVAGGIAGGVVAGPAGFGAGMGAASARTEYVHSIMGGLQEEGVDVYNAEQLINAVRDTELMDKVRTKAEIRGAAIGTVDAVTGGVAGKTLGLGVKSVAGRQAVNLGLQTGIQAGGGAGGEALAQILSEGEITDSRALGAEAAGELVTAPVDVASASITAAQNRGLKVPKTPSDKVQETVEAGLQDIEATKTELQEAKLASEGVLSASDLGVRMPEQEVYDSSVRPAGSSRDMSGIDGLIIAAERQGFDEEVARLNGAKQLYQRADEYRQSGQHDVANTLIQRANEIHRDIAEVPELKQAQSENFPAPYVSEGDIVGGELDISQPVSPQGQAIEGELSPKGVDSKQAKRLGRKSIDNRLTDQNIIYGEEPEYSRSSRDQRSADHFNALYGQEGQTPYKPEVIEGELDRSGELPDKRFAMLPPGTGQIDLGQDRPERSFEPTDPLYEGVGRNVAERQAPRGLSLPDDPKPTQEQVIDYQRPTVEQIDAAAAETNEAPSEAQIEADNYKKGRVKIAGMNIAIENRKGSIRSGTDGSGKRWESKMAHHYGDIKGYKGADGDDIDVFIGDNPESPRVFIVDQIDPQTGAFDEHKVMMGFNSQDEAKAGYLANYEDGWNGLGEISELSESDFKQWLKTDTTKPFTLPKPKQQPASASVKPSTAAKRYSREPDPEHDDLLSAIALGGGIRRDYAEGVDPADYSRRAAGIRYVFPKTKGRSLDEMAEYLRQFGYVQTVEDLQAKLDQALRGEAVLTPEGQMRRADLEAEEQARMAEEREPLTEGTTSDEAWIAVAVTEAREAGVPEETIHSILDTETNAVLAAVELRNEIDTAKRAALQEGPGAEGSSSAAETEFPEGELTTAESVWGSDEDFLSTYSESDIEAREADEKAARDQQAQEEQRAEQKRQADAERNDFTLSGSDRSADVAESRGQSDIFGASQADHKNPISISSAQKDAVLAVAEKMGTERPDLTFQDVIKVHGLPSRMLEAAGIKSASGSLRDLVSSVGRSNIKAAFEKGQEQHGTSPLIAVESDIPYQLAYDAHAGTSHVPEERAKQQIDGYTAEMKSLYADLEKMVRNDDEQKLLETEFNRFRQSYKAKYHALLSAKSKTLSSMITGPARFNVGRNQKALSAEDKRRGELLDLRDKAIKSIKKQLRPELAPIKSGETGAADKLKSKLSGLESAHEKMKHANRVIRSKKDVTRRLVEEVGLTEKQAAEIQKPDFAGRVGFADYSLKNSNAEIRRLRGRIEEEERRTAQAEAANDSETLFEFDGGTVEIDYDDNRIRISHDKKPSEEVRNQLKKSGWRWSRKSGAWQRQITRDAQYSAESITGVSIETPVFSRASSGSSNDRSALTVEAVEAAASAIASRLRLKRTPVVVRATEGDLPAEVLQLAKKQGAEGQIGAVHHKGSIYIVADKMPDALSVEVAIWHESAHYGGRAIFGKKEMTAAYRKLSVQMGGIRGIKAKAEEYGIGDAMRPYFKTAESLPAEDKASYLIDEFLAHANQMQATEKLPARIKRAIKQLIGFVRDLLRKHGYKELPNLSDSDIAYILKQVNKAAQEGEGKADQPHIMRVSEEDRMNFFFEDLATQFDAPAMSRSNSADITENKNGAGMEIKIYSGTYGDPATEIYAYGDLFPTAAENYFGGIFGSTDRSVAESHGDVIQEIISSNHVSHDEFVSFSEQESLAATAQDIAKEILRTDITRSEAEEIVEYALDQKDIHEDDPEMGRERLSYITGHDTDGEIDWSLQGFKGELARRHGFTSVGMPDEHGESILALGGSQISSQHTGPESDTPSGDTMFSRTSENFDDLNEKQEAFLDKIGPEGPLKTLKHRVDELLDNWRLKVRQAVVDRYAPLFAVDKKAQGEDVIETNIQDSAWVLARMASSADGALNAMLNHGRIQLDDGVIDIRGDTKGLIDTLKQLGDSAEIERFMGWIAANRAEKLMSQGRENLFTEEEISAGTLLNEGMTANGLGRAQLYDQVFEEFQQYRDDVLTIADKAGLLRKGMEDDAALIVLARQNGIREDLVKKVKTFGRAMGIAKDPDELDQAQGKHAKFTAELRDSVSAALDDFDQQYEMLTTDQRELWANEFYVPFYRVFEDMDVKGPVATGGISRQEAYKKLKGGTQNLNDLLGNTLMNFNHLITSSLKNMAAQKALENAESIGAAESTSESARDKKQSTFVLRDGMKHYYNVSDPLVYRSLISLGDSVIKFPGMGLMRSFKRVFTNFTTASPQFIAANFIRDTLQAAATSEVSGNVAKNAYQGMKAYGVFRKGGRTRAKMLASGGAFSFGHVYGEDADSIKISIDGELRRAHVLKNPASAFNLLRAAWDKYHDVSDSFENVNRAAIYEQNLEKGKLYAAFKSRDLMDFSQRGVNPVVTFLIDTVPFLNARIQGLDKLYRSGAKPTARVIKGTASEADRSSAARFAAVTGALTMATIALYLHNRDDEDYKALEDWQKDTYWFFRIGEHRFFIPKPFEVGAIATLAERSIEQMVDEQADAELFLERLGHMVSDTFSFNPVPQMVRPLMDVKANEDSFTGRPIESMGMERLSPSLRSHSGTSDPAKWVSKGLESTVGEMFGKDSSLVASPVQVDYMVRQYLGWVGERAIAGIDTASKKVQGAKEPHKDWYEYQPFRRFYQSGATPGYTKYQTEFYEDLKETNRLYADVRKLQELGRHDEAKAFYRDNWDKLKYRKFLNKQQRRLRAIKAKMQMIERSAKTPEAKRRELDLLKLQRNRLVKLVNDRTSQ